MPIFLTNKQKDQLKMDYLDPNKSLLSTAFGETPIGRFADKPLGPSLPCDTELKAKAHEVINELLMSCIGRDIYQEINSGYVSFSIKKSCDAKIAVAEMVLCFLQTGALKKSTSNKVFPGVDLSNARQQDILAERLELVEVALGPYLYDEKKKDISKLPAELLSLAKKNAEQAEGNEEKYQDPSRHLPELIKFQRGKETTFEPCKDILAELIKRARHFSDNIEGESKLDGLLLEKRISNEYKLYEKMYSLVRDTFLLCVDLQMDEKNENDQFIVGMVGLLKNKLTAVAANYCDLGFKEVDIAKSLIISLKSVVELAKEDHDKNKVKSGCLPSLGTSNSEVTNKLSLLIKKYAVFDGVAVSNDASKQLTRILKQSSLGTSRRTGFHRTNSMRKILAHEAAAAVTPVSTEVPKEDKNEGDYSRSKIKPFLRR